MTELTFFRCELCHRVVSPWDVRAGGCQVCGNNRIRPCNLSTWEKIVQVLKHPKVWEWEKVAKYNPTMEIPNG